MKKYISLLGSVFAILVISMSLIGCTKKTSSTTTTTSQTTQTTTTHTLVALSVNTSTKAGIGTYLVDGNGHTLYWTSLDSVGQSNVTGTILANWPIFYVANIVSASPLVASDFGSITRTDGNKQTTYKGRPVYYYINDQAAGDTRGQGINGVWFAVDPSASGPTAATTSTTKTTTTTTTAYPTLTTTSAAATTTTPAATTTPTTATTTPYPGY
jgi:predicted lipoprotein with Yx(FWY)xxD motif